MNTGPAKYRSPLYALAMRSQTLRWLIVLLVCPFVILGTFGGAQILAHQHDNNVTHLHLAGFIDAGGKAGPTHCHGHDHASPASGPSNNDKSLSDQEQCLSCSVVSLADVKLVPARGTVSGKTLVPVFVLAVLAISAPSLPDLFRPIISHGGISLDGPLDLRAHSAGNRLVRTSRALLI